MSNEHITARRAFTLVELLVVIGIIALLIAILMPALSRARKQALEVSCGSNERQVTYSALAYANDWKEQLPTRIGYCCMSGGDPARLMHWARLPIIGWDSVTIWDWATYMTAYYPSGASMLGGWGFLMRDYLKNDFDVYLCPDGFYSKNDFMGKWDGAFDPNNYWGPTRLCGSTYLECPGLVGYKSGYLWLPHRKVSEPTAAIACGGPVNTTDSPGRIVKTASGKPDLQVVADFNHFAVRRYSGRAGECVDTVADWSTCGVVANHPASEYRSLPGLESACMPRIWPPNIGRVENPEQMPLGLNASRVDARTQWRPWQDWEHYRYSTYDSTSYGGISKWHSF